MNRSRQVFASSIAVLLIGWAMVGCEGPADESQTSDQSLETTHQVTITVAVPDNAPETVYLAGNLPILGPWHPAGLKTTGDGTERTATITVPAGHILEFKVTGGSWEQEGLGPSGTLLPNFTLVVDEDQAFTAQIAGFRADPKDLISDWQGSGVEGTLVYWTDVESAHLKAPRHVVIWLPPGYQADDADGYRVIYMHDGQNLFDPRLSYTNIDWGVDEAMMRGVRAGAFEPAIIVGIWNTPERVWEYSPWHDAPAYARFVTEELMPKVESEFNVLTGPDNTFSMGASMGGLISFFLVTQHPDRFSACGCLSTHFTWSPQMVAYMQAADPTQADATPFIMNDLQNGLSIEPGAMRLFFDYGSKGLDASYGIPTSAVKSWLLSQGFVDGENLRVQQYPDADHNETAWRARALDQLTWLLATSDRTPQ